MGRKDGHMPRLFCWGFLKIEPWLLSLPPPRLGPGTWAAGTEPEAGGVGVTGVQYLGLHHVHPPRPQLPHAVVDVHHPFPLGHVQHDVNDDETAGPARTSTAQRAGLSQGGQEGPPLLLPLRSSLG